MEREKGGTNVNKKPHGLLALWLALLLALTLCACGQTEEADPPEEPDQTDVQDEEIPEDDGKGDLIPDEEAAEPSGAATSTTTNTTTNNTTVIHHNAPKQEGRGDVIYDDGTWDSYTLTEDDAYDDGWGDYVEDDYDAYDDSYDDDGWGDYVDEDGWGDYVDEDGWGDTF